MILRKIYNRIYHILCNRSNPSKILLLKKQGCQIGYGTQIIGDTSGFGSEPYLISVGNMCLISAGVCFCTHDGGVSVLNNLKYFGEIAHDKMGRIHVGNNVYIGTNAIILPGITIGDNCVIGAGAVVTKSIAAGSVCIGIPAKVHCSIDEYYERAKDKVYQTSNLTPSEKREFCIKNVK